MFDSVKNLFGRRGASQQAARDLADEARNFKIPSEGVPQVLKYLFFAGLALLNYRLFSHAVPGIWGKAIGCVAILSEITAVYSLHYFSRAAGVFRWALGVSGFLLLAFSTIHGTMSVFDLMGVMELSQAVQHYSKVIAFPLLSGLVGLSVVSLCMTHPKNIIRFQQAKAHTDIEIDRARAASELEIMRNRSAVESARLEFQKEQNRRETEYLVELEKTIESEERKAQIVANISNEQLREAVARDLGIDLSKMQWTLPVQGNRPKP